VWLSRLLLDRKLLAEKIGERERRLKDTPNGARTMIEAELCGLREVMAELGREIDSAMRRGGSGGE
jgi:hypothetical protein